MMPVAANMVNAVRLMEYDRLRRCDRNRILFLRGGLYRSI